MGRSEMLSPNCPMQVQFQIQRQGHDVPPRWQIYTLEVESGTTILECLMRIKGEQDGSLAFRKNCRNTICGSCTMRINGRSALACKENVGHEIEAFKQLTADGVPVISVAPLGNLPVLKDLVVEMQPFWDDLETIVPYVQKQNTPPATEESLQSPEERERLNQTGNCILCGACYSECNGKLANPQFVGPHALAKAQRLLSDNREQEQLARLEQYNSINSGVWGCTRCYLCNTVCPMDVAPMDQIGNIKKQLLSQTSVANTRPVRHRRVLVALVKEGGWVDERKFGLYVMGNYFRDLGGIASILPLGLRMLTNGKFPLFFEASLGTASVRRLIEKIQRSGASTQDKN